MSRPEATNGRRPRGRDPMKILIPQRSSGSWGYSVRGARDVGADRPPPHSTGGAAGEARESAPHRAPQAFAGPERPQISPPRRGSAAPTGTPAPYYFDLSPEHFGAGWARRSAHLLNVTFW